MLAGVDPDEFWDLTPGELTARLFYARQHHLEIFAMKTVAEHNSSERQRAEAKPERPVKGQPPKPPYVPHYLTMNDLFPGFFDEGPETEHKPMTRREKLIARYERELANGVISRKRYDELVAKAQHGN